MEEAKNHPSSVKDWLNSPEIEALREAWKHERMRLETEDNEWWLSLDNDTRIRAFRQIMKLLYIGEVQQRTTYRGMIYNVFGLGPEAYADGLNHFMDIHNLLFKAWEAEQEAERLVASESAEQQRLSERARRLEQQVYPPESA